MIYAILVAALSLIGAAAPLRFKPSHAQLQVYLSAAAGALLGAALFHLLPESSEFIHDGFGLPAALGIIVVFLLQRYVAPHSHEPGPDLADAHAHHHDDQGHHHHDHGDAEHLHAPGPFLVSLIGILALSIHSFFDGVAIGAVTGSAGAAGTATAVSVALSVMIHKPMDGLSVSVLLLNAHVAKRTLWLIQLVYAALVPMGAAAFWLTRGAISEAAEGPFLGYTLAFSAGTFCSIALTDLLPELHFHRHDRNKLSAAMLLSMAVMYAAKLLGGESHGH
jgi:zinc and cadmium transporter